MALESLIPSAGMALLVRLFAWVHFHYRVVVDYLPEGLQSFPLDSPMAWLYALLLFACVYVLFWIVIPNLRIDYYLRQLPTMDGNYPFFGHVLQLVGPAPWSKMALWSHYPAQLPFPRLGDRKQRVVGLVTYNVAGMRVVYISEPKLLRRVLLTHQRMYRKAIAAAYKHFMCLLGTGLVTSEDEQWKRGRLLLSHALRIDILKDIPAMSMKAVDRITRKFDAASECRPVVDLNEEFRHLTLQVIGESSLSLTPEETDQIFPALYLPIVHECNRRVWEPWRAFLPFLEGSLKRGRCLRQLNKVLCDIIQKRWEKRATASNNNSKPDILDLCMSQIGTVNAKVIRSLCDDVKTMLLAGHETSAALLTWATYETILHPTVRQHLEDEARVLFDPKNCKETIETKNGLLGVPTVDEIRTTLVWAPAILRETLRKHSVVPLVMRYATKDDIWPASETGLERDILIPANCTIAVGIEGVHRNPDVWPEPDVFRPERFIDAEIDNNTNLLGTDVKPKYTRRIDPYAFIPFINGPRNCLGQHLSLIETQVTLAYLFLNWDLQLYRDSSHLGDDETWMKEVGRHHDYIIPQVPHDGLKVVGSRRLRGDKASV